MGGGGHSHSQGVGQSPAVSFEAKICAFIQEACIEHLLSETTLATGVHQRTEQTAVTAPVGLPSSRDLNVVRIRIT